MYQPETEDMLPRMAPKPSSAVPSGAGEGIIRPQVPEVSILFGQQDASLPQQTLNTGAQQQFKNNNPQQTYAAWKKQMLPKVTYPAAINMADTQLQENVNNNMIMHDYNTARTNLYPLRSNNTPQLNMASNANPNAFGGVGAQSNPLIYRRSLESCNNNIMYQQMQHLPAQSPLPTLKPVINQTPNTNSSDVLTICAGTQTDAPLDSPTNLHNGTLSNLATKKDVDDVRQMLEEMKHEQQRIVKMLETLLFSPQQQQMAVKPQSRDVGVQADYIENDKSPYVNGGIVDQPDSLQQSVPKNKFIQHLKPNNNILQTPKGKPMAQSTTYRPNSPQRFEQNLPEGSPAPKYQQVNYKPHPVMHRSASDTSLAMNELALKYLPNEKLAELLNELNMDCPLAATATGMPLLAATNVPTTPIKGNADKFEKGPSDISNASYKYLKKYRLLPEDHVVNDGNGVVEGKMENVNKCSPLHYSGRLPLSPLARSSPPQHIVNLENIKYQPKFL